MAIQARLAGIKTGLASLMDQQGGRLFLWLPVAMGAGAALYLALPYEPSWWWAGPPVIALLTVLVFMRHLSQSHYLFNIVLLVLMAALGLAVCKLRTEAVRAPVLGPDETQFGVKAFVIDVVSPSADQPRLLLAPIQVRGLSPEQTPLRLRVTLRPGVIEAADIKPGDTISAFMILNPPPSPAMPGGYDFARQAWYQGIGGVGFVPGRIEKFDGPRRSLRLELLMQLNQVRWTLTKALVRQVEPGFANGRALGGFAAALVTGHEAFIPQPLIQDMRDSGLAHILSISGVHMAIVGGFVFFSTRAAMAAIPALALRFPIKKIAAVIGCVCILIYLAISGSPAPAVRAAVVTCVAFAAILLDRRALSLRALAIAAFIVIALTPESVIQPGFQMSFCATAALLALAETVQPPVRELSVPVWVRGWQAVIEGSRVSLVASFVATLATTPFAIAYFNRFSTYSLLSNLLEAPITAFVVMPCLALGSVLSGTLVGGLFLNIGGGGLWLIERIAAWTSDLPFAVLTLSSAPAYVLPMSFLGLIWVCLIKGRWRWGGLIIASTILWWPRVPAPDIWVDPQGGNAAVRIGQQAYVMRSKVRQYGFSQWTQHYGLTAADEAARDRDYLCRGYGCVPRDTNPHKVGFWFSNKPPNAERLSELCAASRLLILRNPVADWPKVCTGVNRISAGDFRRLGALELSRKPDGWAITASQPLRGKRYWSRPSEQEAE